MIELAVRKPVAVAVGVLLVVLFGVISLLQVPIQLTPDITKPQITVETLWRGASPYEIEREIIDEQEDQLKSVEGVQRMTSESINGLGRIVLEFPPGTDMNAALLRVSNRLEQVPEYPLDADKPVILTSNKTDNAMAWFMLHRLPGNTTDMDRYFRLCDDIIRPRFEREPGVGASNVFGGREEELQVIVRPEDLAERGLTMSQVIRVIDRENANMRGGDFDEGKRAYVVRTLGEFRTPEDVENVVLGARDGKRIFLRDVGRAQEGMKERTNFVRQRGVPTIAVNCVRTPGANVIETMERIRSAARDLNENYLGERGLALTQVYDETEYIDDSIDRVVKNLLLGSALAVTVLFLFLRNLSSTVIVAVAIPISIVGSFIVMNALGRSINVISLAGMSFAAGMVVDNAIVSLENIFRLRQLGRSRREAALEGAREVWGAILASTLTTVAVFLPILFVEEQAGQLFQDIAIAISCSVGLSLIVSITVIPVLASRIMRNVVARTAPTTTGDVVEHGVVLDRLRALVTGAIRRIQQSVLLRSGVVVGLTAVSVLLSFAFLPDAEYLPEGNRNLAIGVILPPPGYTVDEILDLGKQVEKKLAPRFTPEETLPDRNGVARAERRQPSAVAAGEASSTVTGEVSGVSAPDTGDSSPDRFIRHFFFVGRENSVFMGASTVDPARAPDLIPVMQAALSDLPGVIAIVQQASLFERGTSTGRRVDIEIRGTDLERLVAIGGQVFGQVLRLFPFAEGNQARPIPSLDLQTPEIHVLPDRERARDLGLDASEIGLTVDAILDGTLASDYKIRGREVDLTVMGAEPGTAWRTQDLASVALYTPEGRLVPLGSVADIEVTRGPQQVNHIERRRAITIQLVPTSDVPLERAVRILDEKVTGPLRQSGTLGPDYDIRLAGTADDLSRAFDAFKWNFLLALLITYLLMSALFESFLYPFVIMFSVPLAAVGGILCLVLVQQFVSGVQLDVLTMLGFVILVGVVVNNAILIVYQALRGVREGKPVNESIDQAVRDRVRPIFMTTLTSSFGMLPLVLFPGSGSELYRGLGSVVVGGLLVSTVFTLFLIPSLLSLVLEAQQRLGLLEGAGAESGGAGKDLEKAGS